MGTRVGVKCSSSSGSCKFELSPRPLNRSAAGAMSESGRRGGVSSDGQRPAKGIFPIGVAARNWARGCGANRRDGDNVGGGVGQLVGSASRAGVAAMSGIAAMRPSKL